jgi:hypothetical protein
VESDRHCEPTGPREALPEDRLREAIQGHARDSGLLRRFAPRNDKELSRSDTGISKISSPVLLTGYLPLPSSRHLPTLLKQSRKQRRLLACVVPATGINAPAT